MKFFPLFTIAFMLLNACTTQVIIDNPTNDTLNLSIDGKSYTLEALRSKEVSLKQKKVNIILKDSSNSELVNESVQISGEGILNPTRSLYIIHKDIFCTLEMYDIYKKKLNLKPKVIVNEKEYENVDFTLEESLFIPKNWDYNLDEAIPNEITISDFQIVSKIYRVDALEKSFGFMGEIDFSNFTQEEMDILLDSLNNIRNDSL